MNKSCLCLVFVNSAFSFFHINIPRVIYIVGPYWKLWWLGWFQGRSQNNIAEGFEIKLESVLVISHKTN